MLRMLLNINIMYNELLEHVQVDNMKDSLQ